MTAAHVEAVNEMIFRFNERDRRFTLERTLVLCKQLAGVDAFDLDVAAEAGRACAPYWYGVKHDGLRQPWKGRVWCNPPFSDVESWVEKAWSEFHRGECSVIAMLLPANRTDQPFWQRFIEPNRDHNRPGGVGLRTHFLPGRTRFGTPSDPKGERAGSPPFGCVLLAWRA